MFLLQIYACIPWTNGESRLKYFLAIQCWTSNGYNHKFWAFYIVLPACICWCFLLPMLGLIIILVKKRKMNDLNNKIMFGFLCMGYRNKKFYW